MSIRLFAVTSLLGAFVVVAACGDDEATVRTRLDGGAATSDSATEGGPGTLACGVDVPTTYVSADFTRNAAVELAFGTVYDRLDAKMASVEEADAGVVTAAELKAIYNDGQPSLRSVSTTATQNVVDGYLDAFEAAFGKTWSPATANAEDGGAASGGKLGDWYFSSVGLDLRAVATKTLLGGAFYNDVLGVVGRSVTEASVDALLAGVGATIELARRTDEDAGAAADRRVAAYAAKRDDPAAPTGPYRELRRALLTMKAAAAGGNACRAELDTAVSAFLTAWERTTYATAIFYLNVASIGANSADPSKDANALHALGEAIGLVQSFKGIPAERRKITDAQIDDVLVNVGAAEPFKLVIDRGERVASIARAINNVASFEAFSPAEVESFKKTF